MLALTVVWAFVLLRRTSDWQPWLAWTVLAVGLVTVIALLVAHRLPRRASVAAAVLAVAVALAGPAAYSVTTAATPHTGAIPSAGPEGFGMGGAVLMGPRGAGGPPPQGGSSSDPGAPPGMTRLGGAGLLGAPTPPAAAVELLRQDASAYTWAAATVASNNAAAYQLAIGSPVMALGGYNGTDPSPTLEEFQRLVADGRVHWFVGGAGPGGTESGGSDEARRIAEWVAATFASTDVDGVQLYDLAETP